jgi:hypothetical protein
MAIREVSLRDMAVLLEAPHCGGPATALAFGRSVVHVSESAALRNTQTRPHEGPRMSGLPEHDPEGLVWRLRLASADEVRRLTFGEITTPDEFQPGTRRPVPRGPFCERIFGRDRDWECACGRLRGEENVGYICIRCDQLVRHLSSTRFGRIELSSPVVNPLFTKALGVLLNYTPEAFRRIVYFQDQVVVDAGDTPLQVGQPLDTMSTATASTWPPAPRPAGCCWAG